MINPLIPIAGAAVGAVALQAVEKISDALSFADVFSDRTSDTKETDEKNNSQGSLASLFGAGAKEEISTKELNDDAQKSLKQFQENLTRYLEASGIDLSTPIILESDSFGSVRLASDHPQRREIEQLFASHPELNQAFNRLSAQFGLLQASKDQQAFTKLYELDPSRAAEQFSHLFEDDKSQTFSLRIIGDQAEVLS